MKAADTPYESAPAERLPGQFARHGKTGAPIVAHPTKTTKHTGNKADLITLAAAAGLVVPPKATINDLHALLGQRPTKVTYGRPSSLGKQVENMTNIQKWSERAVALGLWLELREIIANVGGEGVSFDGYLGRGNLFELAVVDPTTLDDADAKELLDRVAVRAKSTAQAGLAADRGTHHHELTEDHDNEVDWVLRAQRGEELGVPIPVQAALVAAWSKMLAEFGIEILAAEATCVDDVWRQAGTLDRICRLTRELRFITVTGEYVTLPAGWVGILDIKTGKLRLDRSGFVSYWHGYSVQLASYAQSVPYDPDTDTRSEWPWPIDQQWAVIAHLDVLAALEGEAVCRLVLVDLAAGRYAGAMCVAAREWESRTDVFSIPTDDLAVRVPVKQADDGAALVDEREQSARPTAEGGAVLTEVTPPGLGGSSATQTTTLAVSAPDASSTPLRAESQSATPCAESAPTGTDTAFIEPAGEVGKPTPQADIEPAQVPASPALAELADVPGVTAPVDPSATAGAVTPVAAPAAPLSPLRQAQADRKATNDLADAKRRLHITPEEGDMSNVSTFASVQARYNQLDKAGQSWVKNLSTEADAAGVGFSAKHTKSIRRFELLCAVVQCAADELGDDEVRNLLALIDPRIEQLGSVPLGHIIGSLNATEAAAFSGLATGRLAPTFAANGSHTLTEVAA